MVSTTKSLTLSFCKRHAKKDIETQWRNECGGKILFSHGSSNSAGVAILISYLIVKAYIKDKQYVLVKIYAPSKDKDLLGFFTSI